MVRNFLQMEQYPAYLSWGTHLIDAFKSAIPSFKEEDMLVYGGPNPEYPDEEDAITGVAWAFHPLTTHTGVIVMPLKESADVMAMKSAYRAKAVELPDTHAFYTATKESIVKMAKEKGWGDDKINEAIGAIPIPVTQPARYVFNNGPALLDDISRKIRSVFPDVSTLVVKFVSDEQSVTGIRQPMNPDDVRRIIEDSITDAQGVIPSNDRYRDTMHFIWD